ESYQLRHVARAARGTGRSVRAAHEESPTPQGRRAAAPAAEDPTGRAGTSGGPGDPGPFGATHKAGLSSAECLGTVVLPDTCPSPRATAACSNSPPITAFTGTCRGRV